MYFYDHDRLKCDRVIIMNNGCQRLVPVEGLSTKVDSSFRPPLLPDMNMSLPFPKI
ncbi:hypothetical protein C8J55DRAFT_234095 [Lentinula edodes]|uniref:Uncharacterized protein n=1 Tax=Lentinula lateritia TaxID=40482 RepID=A0A9W8ZU01_9AGAR|nr:hypothetical protein C8J55DRAFT_234095 [Lentinula edodes]